MSGVKHENYEILNLIGYGLSKFNLNFVKHLGFDTKSSLYSGLVNKGVAETTGTIKNRQDLFDPFFDNKRKGWWQKGDTYVHRKILIDSLFGDLDVTQYASVVKLYLNENFEFSKEDIKGFAPVLKSKYKQLQMTGQEAELYFIQNFNKITDFETGILEDARLFGDGYDFQIQVYDHYYLVEVKGLRGSSGSVRITENEFLKATEFTGDYSLVIVSNLEEIPKLTAIYNPVDHIKFTEASVTQEQIYYHSELINW